ncbi:MAG: ATP-binding protein [Candidatus Manganitrophus sp.]|nr:ATP-binding protein [Candidatus Manganitrophus sp.]
MKNDWSRRFRIPSVSAAIALLILIGGIVFAFIISGVSYWMQRQDDIEDLQTRAQQTSDQLNYIVEVLLNKGDLNSVQRIVENITTDRGIFFIAIVDPDLRVLASSQHDLLGGPVAEYRDDPQLREDLQRVIRGGETEFIHHPERGHFKIVAPITLTDPSRAEPLVSGAVTVAFRDDPLVWNPQQNFLKHFQLALAMTTFAMVFVYAVLRRWVTSPLEQLTRASVRLGSGELGIQIPVASLNEIRRLTETFNSMSASLAAQRRAIQASEERYLRIFHSSPLCLVVVDAAGMVVDVNATFLSEMDEEGDRAAWIGKPAVEIPFIRAGGLSGEVGKLLETALPVKRLKTSAPLPGKGSLSFFNFTGIPLFDSEQRMSGAVLAAEDITTERMLEAQLVQSQKMESLGVLAGGVAHDFNNILTGILGYASLLKMKLAPDDPHLPAVEVIEKSGFRARALVQQLMGFARRTGAIKVPVKVNALVMEVVVLLERGVGQGVNIRLDLDPTSPLILADSGQIHQALMNLCINARDALPPEGGTIRLKSLRQQFPSRPDGGGGEVAEWVAVIVEDTGSGIPPEILPRIFDPFFTTKEVGKGTGLGLSVTYGIVKEHGGELTVQSEVGRGTTFTLLFPKTVEAPVRKEPSGKEITLRGASRKILLVDDERSLLELGKKVLEEQLFQVLTAETGEEAIEIYRKERGGIHLIVLDLLMPGLGGWQTYARLREIDPKVKVLFSSGYGGTKDFEALLGQHPYLKKPYRVQELLRAVEKTLG